MIRKKLHLPKMDAGDRMSEGLPNWLANNTPAPEGIDVVTGEIVPYVPPRNGRDLATLGGDACRVLDLISNAGVALEEATTLDEIVNIQSQAEAIRYAAKKAGMLKEQQALIVKLRIDAERKGGRLLAELPKNVGGGDRKSQDYKNHRSLDVTGDIPTYDDIGIDKMKAHRWQTIASLPDDKYEEFCAEKMESGYELTSGGVYQYARNVAKHGTLTSSESNEWYTPARYIESARRVLGSIDVDPASCAIANRTVKAQTYYTKETDGLKQDWPGTVWCNPPYGGDSGPFATRLVEQYRAGITTAAIILVNANSTETKWFAPLWDYILCFTDHRIDFTPSDGRGHGSTHGSVFIYLGPDNEAFMVEFRQYGYVVMVLA